MASASIFEEEEELHESLIVIDDEYLASLDEEIKTRNPTSIAKGIEVLKSVLEGRNSVVMDEDLKASPVQLLTPSLSTTLRDIYDKSKDGTAKREKSQEFLSTLAQMVFSNMDSFKKGDFSVFCSAVVALAPFAKESAAARAISTMVRLGFSRKANHQAVFQAMKGLMDCNVLTIMFNEYTTAADAEQSKAISLLMDPILEFIGVNDPFIKHIIQEYATALADSITQQSQTIASWRNLAAYRIIAEYTIRNEKQVFVFPIVTILTSVLKHFPSAHFLPFELQLASILLSISQHFHTYVPILNWTLDAMNQLCSMKFKGNSAFDWNTALTSPESPSIEYGEAAFDRIQRIFIAFANEQGKSIAFPEFIQPLVIRLSSIRESKKDSKNDGNKRLTAKLGRIEKMIKEQQKILSENKKKIDWEDHNEQLNKWIESVKDISLPLQATSDREQKIAAKLEQLKADDGDILEIATVDDL